MKAGLSFLFAAARTGCMASPDASFGERAVGHTTTFVGASLVLLAMPVLIPCAILFSVVTRTPLMETAPVERRDPPQETIAAAPAER